MQGEAVPHDPHDVIPTSCHDILVLGEKAVRQYWNAPTILNLYPMVLFSLHALDWYVMKDLGREKTRKITAEFGAVYPKWNAVRLVGNGFKHPQEMPVSREQFPSEELAWEHNGWWEGKTYGTDFGGRIVPIDALCHDFILEFSGDLMNGQARQRLPLLHGSKQST